MLMRACEQTSKGERERGDDGDNEEQGDSREEVLDLIDRREMNLTRGNHIDRFQEEAKMATEQNLTKPSHQLEVNLLGLVRAPPRVHCEPDVLVCVEHARARVFGAKAASIRSGGE